ncbi:MAG TPA: pitrilysin family protein [Terriglobales bacterium]|jgi:zinc protease|nr:pitrilysin family protein [Terriglobales bacterium]
MRDQSSVISRRSSALLLTILLFTLSLAAQPLKGKAEPVHVFGPNLVTLPSSSSLYQIQIMVQTGSADDPVGKEGTANLVARALIEGGFGDPGNPVTKEKLAEITRPWGDAATPQVLVDKQATTFSVIVPRDAYPEFVARVLKPMFTQPLWMQAELDRLRREALTEIQSRLRFEDEESLGLAALDNWVIPGLGLDHLTRGTVKGLGAITRDDLASFYKKYYQRGNMFVATSINDQDQLATLMDALPAGEEMFARPQSLVRVMPEPGRHVLIITQPNAIATGLHLGFPIPMTRASDDYWPLFVGNVFLGAHRDDFGRLYSEIREERGYNYGDYSYIEYLYGRPFFLFPPPATPRTQEYFSIWIRPVGHQYAHFIMKAMTAELDRFVKEGLTPEQVAEAKIKARTLYLNYAESLSRQLGYRLDDMFYGMKDNGYLQHMLAKIDAVTPEQVNAAIKKYLQVENLKYVIVTNENQGDKLADDIAGGTNVTSKTLAEYHISEPIPPEKQKMLGQDEQWKAYPLNIPRSNIQVVKAADMFESGPAEPVH